MLPTAVLARALQVLIAVLLVCIAFVLTHGAWLSFARRHTGAQLGRGRAALAGLISGTEATAAERATVRALPGHVQERLLIELARVFGGGVRDQLREIAVEIGAVGRAEARTRSSRWWRRLRGVRFLAAVGASEERMLVQLRDPHPAVRASVAEWAGDHPSRAVLRALLEMLSSSGTLYRSAVQDSLLRVGPPAVQPIAEYLESHGGPGVIPVLRVAAILSHPTLAPAALALVRDPHPLVRAGAAELLGAVGGEQGTAALCELLEDPSPAARSAAAQALGHLGHWPAAHAIAPLLRDAAWDVRRAAGLALRDLGSPGLLFLRRLQNDPDRFAADMATQVLTLPADSGNGDG